MPVENTYSFNWGYDGVDKYAPNHTYGTPDELKELAKIHRNKFDIPFFIVSKLFEPNNTVNVVKNANIIPIIDVFFLLIL